MEWAGTPGHLAFIHVMTPTLRVPQFRATASFCLHRLGPGLGLRSPPPCGLSPHPLRPLPLPCEWIPHPLGFHSSNNAVSEHLLGSAKGWGAQ